MLKKLVVIVAFLLVSAVVLADGPEPPPLCYPRPCPAGK